MDSARSPDERLRAALPATIAAGTARVLRASRSDEPTGPVHNRFTLQEGVADFAAARSHVALCGEDDMAKIVDAEWILHRWVAGEPWNASRSDEMARYASPLRVIDILGRLLAGAVELGPAEHRGDSVTRYSARFTDPVSAVVKAANRVRHPFTAPSPDEESTAVEIWLDEADRARLSAITSAPVPEGDPPRWMSAAMQSAIEGTVGTPGHPVIDTTEVWDFGGPESVTLPAPDEVRKQRREGIVAGVAFFANPRSWKEMRDSAREYADEWRPT
jgi:hypothetical protein